MIVDNVSAFSASLIARSAGAALVLCASLSACSGQSVNMGEGTIEEEAPLAANSRCHESPILEGEIIVADQGELNALEGCEVIEGSLAVVAFEGANLRALHALTTVRGELDLGGSNLYTEDGLVPDQFVLESAWLESLDGLESLEGVGSLTISGLAADNVAPLARLNALWDGELSVSYSYLKNFEGLGSVEGLASLSFNALRALDDLAGLSLPSSMQYLALAGVSLSQQHEPLAVQYVETFRIEDTRLINLEALSNLTAVGSLYIARNHALETLDGLQGLMQSEMITIEDNRALRHIPDMAQLRWLTSLSLTSNPRLTELPAFPTVGGGLEPRDLEDEPELSITTRPQLIEVRDMASLVSFTMPDGWLSAGAVLLEDNPNLTRIDFTRQSFIDYLSIQRNEKLEGVGLGALDKLNLIELIDNPQLASSTFDGVRRLDTNASGNQAP